MKKIITKKYETDWGYEIWLYSPIPGKKTTFEDGTANEGGPLVKIIYAGRQLSVRVHPDDEFAETLEGQKHGKSKSWMILDGTKKGSNVVLGIKDYSPEVVRAHIENHTFEEQLEKVDVLPGQFYNIPAGLVHGIGEGCLILGVQQPTDLMYRYYDFYRLYDGKPRELHLDKALLVHKHLDYNLEPLSIAPYTYKNEVATQRYFSEPFLMDEKSLVVDLKTFDSFIYAPGELVELEKFAVISL